jgi:hypothetical protein
MKVPSQCPLVLLVKVGWREDKAFGSGEGRAMRREARTEVEQSLTAFGQKLSRVLLHSVRVLLHSVRSWAESYCIRSEVEQSYCIRSEVEQSLTAFGQSYCIRSEVEQSLTAFGQSFNIAIGRAEFGEILMLTLGELLQNVIFILIFIIFKNSVAT